MILTSDEMVVLGGQAFKAGNGEPLDQDIMVALIEWAENVRLENKLLDMILAKKLVIRWVNGGEPQFRIDPDYDKQVSREEAARTLSEMEGWLKKRGV